MSAAAALPTTLGIERLGRNKGLIQAERIFPPTYKRLLKESSYRGVLRPLKENSKCNLKIISVKKDNL